MNTIVISYIIRYIYISPNQHKPKLESAVMSTNFAIPNWEVPAGLKASCTHHVVQGE